MMMKTIFCTTFTAYLSGVTRQAGSSPLALRLYPGRPGLPGQALEAQRLSPATINSRDPTGLGLPFPELLATGSLQAELRWRYVAVGEAWPCAGSGRW